MSNGMIEIAAVIKLGYHQDVFVLKRIQGGIVYFWHEEPQQWTTVVGCATIYPTKSLALIEAVVAITHWPAT